MKKAVVLLSGGIDSYTVAVIAKSKGFDVHALSVFYHQRHEIEIQSAKKIVESINIEDHTVIKMDFLRTIGESSLTDSIPIPENRSKDNMSHGIPSTYVPARNTIFLSYALAWAEVLSAKDIFIGVNAVDYSGYPDCRPEYIDAFEKMANLATKAGVEGAKLTIHAPLINMKKSEIIQRGIGLGCDYSLSLSCYKPYSDGRSCGKCDSCLIRKSGFNEAGIDDPTSYA